MNDKRLRFGIGLFVLAGLVTLGTLIYIFSGQPRFLRKHNHYTVVLPDAPGVAVGTPVQRSGVRIGEVDSVELDPDTGEVRVGVSLDRPHQVRRNELPTVAQSLMGDATLELVARKPDGGAIDRTPIEPGTELAGVAQGDARRLGGQASAVIPTLTDTLVEVRKLTQSFEKLTPQLTEAVGEFRQLAKVSGEAMTEFRRTNDDLRATAQTYNKLGTQASTLLQANQKGMTATLESVNNAATRIGVALGDDNLRNLNSALKNFNDTSTQLSGVLKSADEMFKDGRQTMKHADELMNDFGTTLGLATRVLVPLAESTDRIVGNLEAALASLAKTMGNADALLTAASERDGTLFRLLADPSLYNRLNEAACGVVRLLPRVDQISRDLEVFADKVARHPEVLGIGGVVRPGYGIK